MVARSSSEARCSSVGARLIAPRNLLENHSSTGYGARSIWPLQHVCLLNELGWVCWQGSLDGDGDGNGKLGEVGNANIEGTDAKLFGADFCSAVERHCWATATKLHNLHFVPSYSM